MTPLPLLSRSAPRPRAHLRVNRLTTVEPELSEGRAIFRNARVASITDLFARSMANQGGLRRGDHLIIAKAIDHMTAAGAPELDRFNPIDAVESVAKEYASVSGFASRAYTLAEAADVHISTNTGRQRHQWTMAGEVKSDLGI